MNDADLVAQALAGGQAGYAGLLSRHREAVFRLIRHQTGDEGEALDLTQDSFIAAFDALARYDPARPFRAWILRIALNKCRDWARRRRVRQLFTFARPLEEAGDIADAAPDPEAALASAREVRRIRAAIAALPPGLKEPLVLCALEGMSQEEAAALLGLTRKAVEVRIFRARRKLAEIL